VQVEVGVPIFEERLKPLREVEDDNVESVPDEVELPKAVDQGLGQVLARIGRRT
jgi:hypothetical protein